MLEEEMDGNANSHQTVIPPLCCNIIAQSIFNGSVSIDPNGIIHYYSS